MSRNEKKSRPETIREHFEQYLAHMAAEQVVPAAAREALWLAFLAGAMTVRHTHTPELVNSLADVEAQLELEGEARN